MLGDGWQGIVGRALAKAVVYQPKPVRNLDFEPFSFILIIFHLPSLSPSIYFANSPLSLLSFSYFFYDLDRWSKEENRVPNETGLQVHWGIHRLSNHRLLVTLSTFSCIPRKQS